MMEKVVLRCPNLTHLCSDVGVTDRQFETISKLGMLQKLTLPESDLVKLPGLKNLTQLRKLILRKCDHLEPRVNSNMALNPRYFFPAS